MRTARCKVDERVRQGISHMIRHCVGIPAAGLWISLKAPRRGVAIVSYIRSAYSWGLKSEHEPKSVGTRWLGVYRADKWDGARRARHQD